MRKQSLALRAASLRLALAELMCKHGFRVGLYRGH